jgi:hypothetical protein
MKQTKWGIILFIGFILLFSGCKPENKLFDDFFEKEKQNLTIATKEAIKALELENFDVSIYAHKSINNGFVSRSSDYTYWSGSGFTPESSSGASENDAPLAFGSTNDLFGQVEQRKIIANFEPNSKKEITYDYFSILIIFENINIKKKEELLRILKSYVINIERGDNVNIISKEEFNKLQ